MSRDPSLVYRDLVFPVLSFFEDYELVWDYAHDHRDRKTDDPKDDRGNRVEMDKVSGSRFSDPTGSIGTDMGRRRALERVRKKVYGFDSFDKTGERRRHKGILDRLSEAQGELDRTCTPPLDELDSLDGLLIADTATSDEKRDAEARQRKRRLNRDVHRLRNLLMVKEAELRRLS